MKSFFSVGTEEGKRRVDAASALGWRQRSWHWEPATGTESPDQAGSKLVKNKGAGDMCKPLFPQNTCAEVWKQPVFLSDGWAVSLQQLAGPDRAVRNAVAWRTEEWKLTIYYSGCMLWFCFGFSCWKDTRRQEEVLFNGQQVHESRGGNGKNNCMGTDWVKPLSPLLFFIYFFNLKIFQRTLIIIKNHFKMRQRITLVLFTATFSF